MTTVNDLIAKKGSNVWSVAPEDSVFTAIKLMSEKEIGAVCVTKSARPNQKTHNGILVGIISERDYARSIILQGRRSRETPVGDIMTRNVITVAPDQKLDNCLTIMTEGRFRHLPVVENQELIGLISIGDLVKRLLEEKNQVIDQLETYITR